VFGPTSHVALPGLACSRLARNNFHIFWWYCGKNCTKVLPILGRQDRLMLPWTSLWHRDAPYSAFNLLWNCICFSIYTIKGNCRVLCLQKNSSSCRRVTCVMHFAQKCMLPFLVLLYYIWIFGGKFSFACLQLFLCSCRVSTLLLCVSCVFVLADSPGCQRPSCLLDSFLSGFLGLLLVFSGAFPSPSFCPGVNSPPPEWAEKEPPLNFPKKWTPYLV